MMSLFSIVTLIVGSQPFTASGFDRNHGANFFGQPHVHQLQDTSALSPLFQARIPEVPSKLSGSCPSKLSGSWFPRPVVAKDDFDYEDDNNLLDNTHWLYTQLEQKSVSLMARLVKQRLTNLRVGESINESSNDRKSSNAYQLAKGRFIDLTCTVEGERILESLLDDDEANLEEENVVQGAIMALQSLTMVGCQVGVKGSPEQLERRVSHLRSLDDEADALRDLDVWDADSIRRLKYRVDQTAGLQLLAEIKWKRSAQGAFDLFVALGAWTKHEDLALLRSGFPLRFTDEDEEAAKEAATNTHDPDELLEIRQNMCNEKIYTIDSATTMDIDDGLSVELMKNEDGSERHRLWVHISDSDHFAPRYSRIFQIAKRRATSLYLPQGSIPMFPSSLSSGVMSLKDNRDLNALSLGVELNPDGSVDDSSIIVTPSRIRVSYRLTYDEADEMLDEGVGYREEWQLGVLFEAAKTRRKYRIENGSSEGLVPNPIPQSTVAVFPDPNAPDGIGISVQVQVSHNAGKNGTSVVGDGSPPEASIGSSGADPVSSSFLLVTEMMILAGEALGRFKLRCDREADQTSGAWESKNSLDLPFRSQPKPDYNSRARERRVMEDLLEYNLGGGYCHAWYTRRFLQPVKISEIPYPHAGLGIACYVQWSSPIRRFGDLQVHAAVKRFLRRARVNDLQWQGQPIPSELRPDDLGCSIPGRTMNGVMKPYSDKVDFQERQGIIGVARLIQRSSQQYWLFEHVRRLKDEDPDVTFDVLVLGCVDPERQQYAIYVYDLGLEHRYVSQKQNIRIGEKLRLKVASVFPQAGLLTLSLC